MEQQEEFKIYLLLKKQTGKPQEDAILHVRIKFSHRMPVETSTRIIVPIALWDQKNQQIRNRQKNQELCREVDQMVKHIETAHQYLTESGGIYCSKTFADHLHGSKESKQRISYLFLYEKHQSIYNEDLAPGTWKNYRSTNLRFKEFLKNEYRVADIEVSGFKRQLIIEFIAWLKKRQPDEG